MYTLPLSDEDSAKVRELTTITRGGSGTGHYLFTVSKAEVGSIKDEDIMLACGYHPLGYGQAFDHEEKDGIITFKCWGSCD